MNPNEGLNPDIEWETRQAAKAPEAAVSAASVTDHSVKPERPTGDAVPPLRLAPRTAEKDAETPAKSPPWKELREWSALVISLIALGTSVVGYLNSRASTDLAQKQFDADRAIIVVGEKEDKPGTDGTMFKFHSLSTNQRLSVLEITFPSVIEKGPRRAVGPQQEMSLIEDKFTAGDYFMKKAGALKPGTFGFRETSIPVVIDTFYSVAGVSAQRRGLYYLTTYVSLTDDSTRADVSFEDFAFVQELGLTNDAQKVVDDIFAAHQIQPYKPKRAKPSSAH